MGHFGSLARGRSVRSPNVRIMLMSYGAFRKPRAGALGSLTECPLDIRPNGVRELTPAGYVSSHRAPDSRLFRNYSTPYHATRVRLRPYNLKAHLFPKK